MATFHALEQAARDAPHGCGIARVESALHDKGFDHLRAMLRLAVSAHAVAQKRGRGQPIGTGLIEGGCKNIIAARLTLNSARWRVRRAERMGAIRCVQYSGLWDAY